MAKKETKTNAIRILERMKIPYEQLLYACDAFTDGSDMADKQGLPHDHVFKTLVTFGADRQYYVFVIPVDEELDLKKCARSVGVKSVQMIPMKDLTAVTGYIRGGCTAIGMKKPYPVRLEKSALLQEKIYVSGGRVGCSILLKPEDFCRVTGAEYAELIL